MRNGGGPACLRLRVTLTEKEMLKTNPAVFLDETLYKKLVNWVNKHYRDDLTPRDLADPNLLKETRSALDELTHILKLGSVYPFQLFSL
jgi:succinylarginine dihydrolase